MSKKRPRRGALFTAAGEYSVLLADIKRRIRAGQVRTAMAGNASMLMLYWEIGGVLAERQKQAGWGAGVLRRLSVDLHNDLPEVKGFSERNLKLMVKFYGEYPEFRAIGQRPVAQLPDRPSVGPIRPRAVAKLPQATNSPGESIGQLPVAQLPWAHNVILIQKVKDLPTRIWYARQALEHGWSRDVLSFQIESQAHERHGKAVTNFKHTLPPPQSDLASQLLKDPYLFDFLTLEKPFHERELETGLLRHLQEFLVALGTGFAFVGRQVHLEVDGDDFYLDLLFYHLRLRCFMVIGLKVGRFKAEYAGKMNFYFNVVDDRMGTPRTSRRSASSFAKIKTRSSRSMPCAGWTKPSVSPPTNSRGRCRRNCAAHCRASSSWSGRCLGRGQPTNLVRLSENRVENNLQACSPNTASKVSPASSPDFRRAKRACKSDRISSSLCASGETLSKSKRASAARSSGGSDSVSSAR